MRHKKSYLLLLSLLLVSVTFSASALDSQEWQLFKQRYITAEGRVLDTANGDISHSEGQGIAMFFAAAYNDRPAFELLWRWTRAKLQVRDDHLFAWKWDPRVGEVTDANNASDGDVLIAWALYLADKRWEVKSYRHSADYIADDIRHKLIRQTDYGAVLLPGMVGFENSAGITVNLSYWVFPAFSFFARQGHAAQWNALSATGERLLRQARFGRWGLPPDWLLINGQTLSVVSHGYAPHFGYNAVRIPLYLAWDRRDTPTLLQPFASFWRDVAERGRGIPAWVDLNTDQRGSYDAPRGFYSILNFVNERQGRGEWVGFPGGAAWREHYYSASLRLMVDLARRRIGLP